MLYDGRVMKDISNDPFFKIRFSYESDNVSIKSGYAEVVRLAPVSIISFGPNTAERLKLEDKAQIEMELLNTVISHLISKGTSRTLKGRLVLYSA